MTCYLCNQRIEPQATVNRHHYETLKSEGGKLVAPTHQQCHIEFHSRTGQFKEWGRIGGQISALSKQWAFNLLNVRSHPAHEINRSFNRAMYAH